MRLNFFSQNHPQEAEQATAEVPVTAAVTPPTGKTFPADEIVWGIVIRNGFDELDDPAYHRGTTQHAYLEGNDNVAICGFRPPQSGPRTRRRSRLGLPTTGIHPMCGICARMVVAPRPRVPVPVQSRAPVALPVARPVGVPFPAAPMPNPAPMPAAPMGRLPGPATAAPVAPQAAMPPTSPWVRQRTEQPGDDTITTIELGTRHDSGLLQRGVHTQTSDD